MKANKHFKDSLGFIGLGNMGSAIMKGFANAPQSKKVKLFGFDTAAGKKDVVKASKGTWCASANEVVHDCKYVVLAVKPQVIGKLLEQIRNALTDEHVLISVCAGVSPERIRQLAHPLATLKIIQVMPNMPMTLGLGACAIAYTDNVPPNERTFARMVLKSCGTVEEIPSFRMNEIIAVNASSPAFIFTFAKCFIEFAESNGIDGDAAFRLFSQTLTGSAAMLVASKGDISGLISQITSESGTTAAGLEAMQTQGFTDAVKAACTACTQRAYELGQ
jgi:pyrroline-5-carboxylate reductase